MIKRMAMVALFFISMKSYDADAQIQSDVVVLDAVVVKGVKNPQEFDPAKGLELIQKFEKIPNNDRSQIKLNFVLERSNPSIPFSDIQLAIDVDGVAYQATIDKYGHVWLPELTGVDLSHVRLVSNQPKHSLKIIYKIALDFGEHDEIDYQTVKSALKQARNGWRAVLPSIAKMIVPSFNCIEFNFNQPENVELIKNTDVIKTWGQSRRIAIPLAEWQNLNAHLAWSRENMIDAYACKV